MRSHQIYNKDNYFLQKKNKSGQQKGLRTKRHTKKERQKEHSPGV
jgi:hypothetical protein